MVYKCNFFSPVVQNNLFSAHGSAGALLLHFIPPLFALAALVCAVVCLDPDSVFEVLPIFRFLSHKFLPSKLL